jgi:hypothetical protein
VSLDTLLEDTEEIIQAFMARMIIGDYRDAVENSKILAKNSQSWHISRSLSPLPRFLIIHRPDNVTLTDPSSFFFPFFYWRLTGIALFPAGFIRRGRG